jgi:RNA polymerase sigma factor (TIGR02999 family)
VPPLELQEEFAIPAGSGADLVAIDDALQALAAVDPRKSQVVELRFFGGLSVKETAEVLNVSVETVERDWRLARSWLRRELRKDRAHGA